MARRRTRGWLQWPIQRGDATGTVRRIDRRTVMPPPLALLPRRAALALAALVLAAAAIAATAAGAELPTRLSATGAPMPGQPLPAGVATFTPQYPLWSDGSDKRRWIRLPAGTAIDASDPDAWVFPPGTRLWKEFSVDGRRVETRLIERMDDGSWRYAAYLWDADGRDATLAPARGATLAVPGAPKGRYTVPSRGDCVACHGSARAAVVGFAALQLSPERDPLITRGAARPGDVDLRSVAERGWLRGLPAALLADAPRVAAASPVERAALGHLHGNCAHCHNTGDDRAPVRLTLALSVADPAGSRDAVLRTLVDAASRWRPSGSSADARVVVAGRPDDSTLFVRMRSRDPRAQMPPLGSVVPDPEGLALVQRWIEHHLAPTKELQP